MCESYVQPYSKPCSSAFCINSISRVYGGSGRTVTPKVRAIGDEHTRSRREFQPPFCETGDVITHFWAFLGVSAVVIVTPGQDTALTIRNTLRGGRRSGLLTAAGVSGGQAVWALATSAGVAAGAAGPGPPLPPGQRPRPAHPLLPRPATPRTA